MKKLNVEVAPAQVRKLKEPFTITSPANHDVFITLSKDELIELSGEIVAVLDVYGSIMEGKK